jgi:membrane fusion protein (multidrug efflux system)
VEEAEAALLAAEGSFAASKADIESLLPIFLFLMPMCNRQVEILKLQKLDWVVQQAILNAITICIKIIPLPNNNLSKLWLLNKKRKVSCEFYKTNKRQVNFRNRLFIAKSNVTSKQTEVAAANIKRAQALLDAAKLNLAYTVVTASIDGQVSKITMQPGQLVQPGQSLFYIINNAEAWVIANFKETQLNKMVEGQKVSIKVDAYPDTTFEGTIASFSPATGARFSLLPPDNATGNFVKTIQRLPVKITLDTNNDP